MRQAEYLKKFQEECSIQCELTNAKNGDYATVEDAFANFRAVEHFGVCSVEVGILTRMSDKFVRVCNLIKNGNPSRKVADEAVTDTLRDLSVYAKILKIYLESK